MQSRGGHAQHLCRSIRIESRGPRHTIFGTSQNINIAPHAHIVTLPGWCASASLSSTQAFSLPYAAQHRSRRCVVELSRGGAAPTLGRSEMSAFADSMAHSAQLMFDLEVRLPSGAIGTHAAAPGIASARPSAPPPPPPTNTLLARHAYAQVEPCARTAAIRAQLLREHLASLQERVHLLASPRSVVEARVSA